MLGQRADRPKGGTTEGQPSPAHFFRRILAILATLGGAVLVGWFVTRFVVFERLTDLPVMLAVLFAALAGFGFVLTVLVADRLWDLYRVQRKRLSGAKMHARLALVLSIIALLPAGVAFTLTGVLLNNVTDEFFVNRIEANAEVSRNLANAYATSVSRQMGFNIVIAERDLSRARARGIDPKVAPIGYRRYLTGLAQIYEFAELAHISTDGRVVVRTNVSGAPIRALPPKSAFDRVQEQGVAAAQFGAIDPKSLSTYFIIIPISSGADGYLVGYRLEDPRISNELVAVQDLRNESRELRRRTAELFSLANIAFLLLSIVLLLAAAWIGLLVANAIVGPIRRLATAAERVSAGDLEGRVEVRRRDGELGDLGRAFNDMTERLALQRDDLIAAGEEAEDRRRFIETMLSVIPAGVISVDKDGEIGLANPSAAAILGEKPRDLVGRDVRDVVPDITKLFREARRTGRGVRESVDWSRRGQLRSLVIEISPETEHGPESPGFVVTIEDITELVTAQRTAAWADVARRIAHEIKNPLTPIQLSAERLRRRYASELEGRDKEVFDQCTATIIRNVGDIGRMVTEFSSFARMPAPIMAENDLREVAREALFPFGVSHPSITFFSDMPAEPVPVLCDGRLIAQALTNLIKNAAEAILEAEDITNGKVEVEVTRERTGARIEVRDNGKGLPEKLRHRLTEPYMTTREKGTGLGLAIVRKAIEDHDGSFEIRNRPGGGAVAAIFLPTLPTVADQGDTQEPGAETTKEEPVLHGH